MRWNFVFSWAIDLNDGCDEAETLIVNRVCRVETCGCLDYTSGMMHDINDYIHIRPHDQTTDDRQ